MLDTTKDALIQMQADIAKKLDATDSRLNVISATVSILGAATALALATNSLVEITPTANITVTTTVPTAGAIRYVKVLTSGTTSRTITFGTGFKSTATLVTGTTSGRVFILGFVSDGTNLYEASRTAAMAA